MSETIEEMQKRRHRVWIRDWSDGLAYCRECDHEYTNAQTIIVDEEKSCPNCKKPENKTYYYCPEDGSRGCECKWH